MKAFLLRLASLLLGWWARRQDAPSEHDRDMDEVKDEVDKVPRSGRDQLLGRLRDDDRST